MNDNAKMCLEINTSPSCERVMFYCKHYFGYVDALSAKHFLKAFVFKLIISVNMWSVFMTTLST